MPTREPSRVAAMTWRHCSACSQERSWLSLYAAFAGLGLHLALFQPWDAAMAGPAGKLRQSRQHFASDALFVAQAQTKEQKYQPLGPRSRINEPLTAAWFRMDEIAAVDSEEDSGEEARS